MDSPPPRTSASASSSSASSRPSRTHAGKRRRLSPVRAAKEESRASALNVARQGARKQPTLGNWIQVGKPAEPTVKASSKWRKGPKQAKIGDLKRVVPLDEVTMIEAKLRAAREPESDISDATVTAMLVKLKAYPLTKEMLVKTRVGRVVKKLASHRVSTVRAVAKELVKRWTALIGQKQRPKIEVKTAKPLSEQRNERDRQTARDAITARLVIQFGGDSAAAAAASGGGGGGGVGGGGGADGDDDGEAAPPTATAPATVSALAVEVEDQLYAHAYYKVGKHYNRFQATLMRAFDKNKYLGKKIESIVKAGKGQQLRQLFGEPDYS